MELYLASLTPLDPHLNNRLTQVRKEVLIHRFTFDDTFKVAYRNDISTCNRQQQFVNYFVVVHDSKAHTI